MPAGSKPRSSGPVRQAAARHTSDERQAPSRSSASRQALRHALAVALVAAVLVLPGCLQKEAAPPAAPQAQLAFVGGKLNQAITVTPDTRQANELSIAIDPTNPLNLIATGKDYTPEHAGECVWDGLYVSHDGGATWSNRNLPGSPWKMQNDAKAGRTPEPHPQLSRFYCATDPVVKFGPDGWAYWSVMPYQCDPASGSKTGADTLPPGGLNDWFWTCSSMYVLASQDKGETWPIISEVAFGPRLIHDKQWLSISPQNRILLCWDQAAWASGAATESYNALRQGTPLPEAPFVPVPEGPVPTASVCAVSDDHAATWTQADETGGMPVATTDGFTPWIDHAADGTAWMTAVTGRQVIALHSQDGLDWSDPVVVANYTIPPAKIMNGFSTLNGSAFRVGAYPVVGVDRSTGPHGGNIYTTWMDAPGGQGLIMFAASRDRGASWQVTPLSLLARNETVGPWDQFMPTLDVGPDGTVDVAWFDRRNDPDNHLFDLYYSFSVDGGASFAPPLRVSETSSNEKFSHHQNGAIFMGDYIDMASAQGTAHPIWVDTRNEKADAYTATIVRPSANDVEAS